MIVIVGGHHTDGSAIGQYSVSNRAYKIRIGELASQAVFAACEVRSNRASDRRFFKDDRAAEILAVAIHTDRDGMRNMLSACDGSSIGWDDNRVGWRIVRLI